MRFRKKVVVIEAMRVPTNRPVGVLRDPELVKILQWVNANARAIRGTPCLLNSDGVLVIRTLEGEMRAGPGDWVIRGIADEFYPCKPDIFEATYEPTELPRTTMNEG